jgi:hypothetical protein
LSRGGQGNILLTPDRRLGLIDYGQIKVLTQAQRKQLARIIVALADHDEEVGPLGRDPTGDRNPSFHFPRFSRFDDLVECLGRHSVMILGVHGRHGDGRNLLRLSEQETVRLFQEMGFRSQHSDPWVIWRVASLWFDRDDDEITGGLNLQVAIRVSLRGG